MWILLLEIYAVTNCSFDYKSYKEWIFGHFSFFKLPKTGQLLDLSCDNIYKVKELYIS